MAGNVCAGSPWKSPFEVTHATLELSRRGIDVAGMSDEEALRLCAEATDIFRLLEIEPQETTVRRAGKEFE